MFIAFDKSYYPKLSEVLFLEKTFTDLPSIALLFILADRVMFGALDKELFHKTSSTTLSEEAFHRSYCI